MNQENFDIKQIEDIQLYIANDGVGDLAYVDCPICKNKGYIAYRDTDGYIASKKCKCLRERKIRRNIERSGLKNDFERQRFDNFICDEPWKTYIFDKAVAYTKEIEPKWFTLSGAIGSGKTHLCTAITSHLINQGMDVEYVAFISRMPSLQMDLNSFNSDKRDKAENYLERLKTVEVLYFDDFMKIKSIKLDLIFDIIDYRYRNPNLRTIISSELTYDDLKKYDYALASRIFERCNGYFIVNPFNEKKNYREKNK